MASHVWPPQENGRAGQPIRVVEDLDRRDDAVAPDDPPRDVEEMPLSRLVDARQVDRASREPLACGRQAFDGRHPDGCQGRRAL
jgi:hypothetical protein